MTTAYEDAVRVLGFVDRTDAITEIVAKKIIEIAQTGERDPLRIRARAIAVGVARELMFNSQACWTAIGRGGECRSTTMKGKSCFPSGWSISRPIVQESSE